MKTLFTVVNTGVLLPWALMIFAPGWKWTQRIIYSLAIPLLIAFAYIALVVPALGSGSDMPDFSTLDGIRSLFQDDTGIVAGWFHYLAFDLFVGSWELSDARKHGIGHAWLVPCLLFTFMMGPAGMALYLAVRWYKLRSSRVLGD